MTCGVWFVEIGVSRHMTGSRDIFTSMAKEHRNLHMELGDSVRYVVDGIGSI